MSAPEDPLVDPVNPPPPQSANAKKKKKKSKKKAKPAAPEAAPPVLCISRNKHWKYISSYHGPWLQLPVELLDSLVQLNTDPPPLPSSKPAPRLWIRVSRKLGAVLLRALVVRARSPPPAKCATMSAMRIHRLRALAVQKLAQAYRMDEIASSVVVMQGGTVFDDIAERVLRHDPNDSDARYVHFFHEKIPSRQLAESTSTRVLDELIAAQPNHLEYFRTRGIVRCFRDEYPEAVRDFTHAIKESRAQRKHHMAVVPKKKRNGQAPPEGTAVPLPIAPLEPQALFLRGAAHLSHALHSPYDDIRLSNLPAHAHLGGIESGNPLGLLGARTAAKFIAYRDALQEVREQVEMLARKCVRDMERFLAYFASIEGECTCGASTPTSPSSPTHTMTSYPDCLNSPPPLSASSSTSTYDFEQALLSRRDHPHTYTYTTYHPLTTEAHFTVLLALLLLGAFDALRERYELAMKIVEGVSLTEEGDVQDEGVGLGGSGLEGYPVFLPPRSLAKAEWVECMNRLGAIVDPPPGASKGKTAEHKRSFAEEDYDLPSSSSSRSSTPSSSFYSPALSSSSSMTLPVAHGIPLRPDAPRALEALRGVVYSTHSVNEFLSTPPPASPRAPSGKAKGKEDVAARTRDVMRERAKVKDMSKSLNIPLFGPRVDVVLAWVDAMGLAELGI
ncbi:hypothetical protein BD626DRAFT_533718 [Schizophyllum amplum]|uniref:Uncharacterized protein n=1 Tax=Schizophyllum amplum TaxID=97359 RepID=A0A550D0B0_9AGAR|nr:hypothetical protein BD626DRAFT_533718 [Auriculariopsis ampla]